MNYIFRSQPITDPALVSNRIDLSGQPTVSANVVGTISAGHLTPQVSNDGINWFSLPMFAPDASEEATITQPGLYRADVNGWMQFRLAPSNDFSGAVTIEYIAFSTPMTTKIVSGVDMSSIANEWVAGTYPANSIVLHNGTFWANNSSTSGTPGVSGWNNYATLADLLTYILTQ